MNDYQLPIVACVFLFVSMLLYWISLWNSKNTFFFQVAKSLIICSNILFFLTLGSRWIFAHYFPLSNLYESLIFLSWGLSFLHLFFESKTQSRVIGSLSTPLLFFLSAFSSFILPIEMQKAFPLVPSLQSNWLMMHVSMMMVSYATLIVGSLLSVLLVFLSTASKDLSLVKDYKLLAMPTKATKDLPFVSALTEGTTTQQREEREEIIAPESLEAEYRIGKESLFSKKYFLETLDIWSYRIIGIGFPFLTIGIISGAVWANEAWGSYWSWDPKETWALITWLVFAIYLHGRLVKGWEGKKAAILASTGFFVIWICYLGVNFLGKGLHSYGWVL